jgi:hypothetical protein
LEKKGHFSWGDAALAPGGYKSAPLALNCGFQGSTTFAKGSGDKNGPSCNQDGPSGLGNVCFDV